MKKKSESVFIFFQKTKFWKELKILITSERQKILFKNKNTFVHMQSFRKIIYKVV